VCGSPSNGIPSASPTNVPSSAPLARSISELGDTLRKDRTWDGLPLELQLLGWRAPSRVAGFIAG
jgi:hypothetical protein